MGDTKQYCAAVLPWLQLEREATVGRVRFVRFDTELPPNWGSPDAVNQLIRRLVIHKDIKGNPIKICTLALLEGEEELREFNEDERAEIGDATQAFCFACLAKNEFFTVASGIGTYVNSSYFRTHFQRFVVGADFMGFLIQRRDGAELSGWRCEDVAVTVPIQCTIVRDRDIEWDDSFLSGLWHAMQKSCEPLASLIQAIWLFNSANSDEQWVPEDQQLVQAVEAFEYLLPGQDKGAQPVADFVLQTLDHVSTPSATHLMEPLKAKRLSGTWIGEQIRKGNVPDNKRPLYYWVREVHKRRSDIVHNLGMPEDDWAWGLGEHLVMSAFVFPLVVKCLLVQKDIYRLADEDNIKLGLIDELLYMDNWGSEDPGGESNWSKAIKDAAWHLAYKQKFSLRELDANAKSDEP